MSERKGLESHPLVLLLLNNIVPQVEQSFERLKASKAVRIKDGVALDEHEWYDRKVFDHVASILSAIDRLKHCETFIQSFPRPRLYEKKGISQHVWIEYHYVYFVITLVSLPDICFLLTNAVFRLGISERDCKPELIKKNEWVSGTRVKDALARLEKSVSSHKEPRNLLVHRGQLPDLASVIDSEELDTLKLISFLHVSGSPILERSVLDLAYKGQVEEVLARLVSERTAVTESLSEIFDTLLPVYQGKSKALRFSCTTARHAASKGKK